MILKIWLELFDIASDVTVISRDLDDNQCDLAIRLDAYAEAGDSFNLSMFLYTYSEITSFGSK